MPGDDGGVSIPLGLFSSLDTELFPPPEGLSPDNSDCIYNPQSVGSREGLHKILSAAIPGNPQIVYHKTYVQPNGNPLTLVLDATGSLWKEDVANLPGVLTLIAALPLSAGSSTILGQSCSAFGREYIATSDGQNGIGAPLQYDGVNLDRVSQDGPGAPPTVSEDTSVYTIKPNTGTATSGLFNNTPFGISSISMAGNVVTVITATSFRGAFGQFIQPGDIVHITGVPVAGYNATWTVLALVGNNGFQFVNNGAALGPSGAPGVVNTSIVEVVLTAPHPFTLGQLVTIAGAGVAGYDGTWQVVVLGTTSPTATIFLTTTQFGLAISGGGTLSPAGTIVAGLHRAVVLFQTRTGYITAPSSPVLWVSTGNKRILVSGIPIGPSNVIARIMAFTGSGGDNYFYIPVPQTVYDPTTGAPSVIPATVVFDNTSDSATFDFSDNSLFAATAIDIPGRNYFANVVLGGCLGFFFFSSRLFAWGEYNKLQNLLNMGFEGGTLLASPTVPLGWSVDSAGGTLVVGGSTPSGNAWQISGSGPGLGFLSQSAYQDTNGIAILQPNTLYSVRAVVKLNVSFLGFTPRADFEFFSPSMGSLAICSIIANTGGSFITANFGLATPAVIPPDTVFRFSGSGMHIGFPAQNIQIDELQLFPTLIPFRNSLMRASYFTAGEQFDGVTGNIGPTDDSSPLRALTQIRGTLYLDTANGKHSTTDNGTGEPSTWTVNPVTDSAGVLGVHATDPGKTGTGDSGEQWEFFAGASGPYIFAGGDTLKIGQEVQGIWDRVNLAKQHLVWVKNDYINRRCYFGLPLDGAASPNKVLVLDYNNLNDASAIANTGPIREGMNGKLVCREFSRKWSLWNLEFPCGELLTRPGNVVSMCFGSGPGGAAGTSFGNFYYLDPLKLTDDDYGTIVPYYTTYPFGTSDQEQQLGLSRHKLATYLSANLLGTGLASITPYSNVLANQYPELPRYPLTLTQDHDMEWDINVDGERIGLRIGSVPINGVFPVTLATITQNAPTTASFTMAVPTGVFVGLSFGYAGTNPALTGTWTITIVNSPTSFVATAVVSGVAGDVSTLGAITVTGQTDNKFILQGLNFGLKSNPWAPIRGAF